jgi:hypothetical protein
MTRAITVCVTVLVTCLATSTSAEDLPVEKIVSVGQNTFKIRVGGKLLHVAAERAMQRANEYCAGMKQTVIVKYRTWDMGYGYTLTWNCQPPQHAPIGH